MCGEHEYEQRQALLGQVGLAQQRSAEDWLSDLARFAYKESFEMCSDACLERNISAIPDWAWSSTGRPPCRDRRRYDGRSGACRHVYDEFQSNSRTSKDEEEEWKVVNSPKRERRLSPIKWDEIKVVIDRGCFNPFPDRCV
ncbi:hypothetical protein DPMN_040427 [Dreissena polymorpha]|uniref:Uncharacterized protein n=1 Tax=Dreissena polymorpha TaxID=45954 RepID=A0A9D4HV99_DREPO|nr:hypothetical protein DPMN_040427 [Dreissena polymorpha]